MCSNLIRSGTFEHHSLERRISEWTQWFVSSEFRLIMRETLLTGDPTSPMIFGKSLPCCFFVVLLKEMQSEFLLGKAPLEERAARNQSTVRTIFIFCDTFLPQFFKFVCSHSLLDLCQHLIVHLVESLLNRFLGMLAPKVSLKVTR
uniref:(northern house mosquito) hypothetical protein n=1 Tax=Culex pipiens TaxID=7175 RepID=A0A8D8N573_CULPI